MKVVVGERVRHRLTVVWPCYMQLINIQWLVADLVTHQTRIEWPNWERAGAIKMWYPIKTVSWI
jgi:hypothetical protein